VSGQAVVRLYRVGYKSQRDRGPIRCGWVFTSAADAFAKVEQVRWQDAEWDGPWSWWDGSAVERRDTRGETYRVEREVLALDLTDMTERDLDDIAVAIDAQRARGVGR
jgi:hypothetical protein